MVVNFSVEINSVNVWDSLEATFTVVLEDRFQIQVSDSNNQIKKKQHK